MTKQMPPCVSVIDRDYSSNTPLDVLFWAVRDTRKNSDYLGNCEICKTTVSSTHYAQLQHVWRRADGQHYLNGIGGGTYGHLDCLIKAHGSLRRLEDFPRDGVSQRQVTTHQLSMIKATP